jgi:DNA primase
MTLVELAQSYGMTFEHRGNRYWAKCPWHPDGNPSFNISQKDAGQVYYCYSCKRGGGPVSFISEMEQIPEYEAVRLWAKLNGKEPPLDDREYLYRFVDSLEYHPYLEERGIDESTAKRFRTGYCKDYQRVLKEIEISVEHARTLGLWDVSDCIVYPWIDRNGIYKIGARPVKEKAYRTSPDVAKFFAFGLYGIHLIRGDEAWIFEGYHDAMVAYKAGYPALAAGGTNLKEEQWLQLRDYGVRRITLVPDGDKAGREWAKLVCATAPKYLTVELVMLDNGDPDDELLREGRFNQKRWNTFEWYVTHQWGSPVDFSTRSRMLDDIRPVFLRMSAVDRSLAREWYRQYIGDDEVLSFLQDGIKPNLEAERAVIANSVYSDIARLEAQQELNANYFTNQVHQKAFELCRNEVSSQLLITELNYDYSDFADLLHYRRYIEKVRDYGQQKSVERVLREADPAYPGEVIEQIYKCTDKIEVRSGEDLVRSLMVDIDHRVKEPGLPGVEIVTLPTLNKLLLGWRPEKYILISGNSGHGKTTMLCNFLNDVIDDHPTLFFSLEMTDKEIMEKMLAIRSGIPSMKITTGSLEQAEYDAVMGAGDTLMHGNMEIVNGVSDIHKIEAIAKSHSLRRGIRFIAIDYLQLITIKTRDERWEQLISISNALKNLATSLPEVTVIALSQLNRRGLSDKYVPDASDQAGSYGILAPSDGAMTVSKRYPKENGGSNFLINVSKNRFGYDSAEIACLFDRGLQKISELVG